MAGPASPHSLEHLAQRYRNYVRPADYLAFGRVLRHLRDRTAQLKLDPARTVVFELADPRIDREHGRYAFGLVKEFIAGGWSALLAKSFWYLSSMERKRHKRLLLKEPVGLFETPPSQQLELLVTDREPSPLRAHFRRTILLDYDSRLGDGRDLPRFPYRPHPEFDAEPDLGDEGRTYRVAFLGHWNREHYDDERDLAQFGVMTRWRMIQTLLNTLPPEDVHIVRGSEPAPDSARFLLSADEDLPDLATYRRLLRRSDFFLACPGTGFPLCHNLIESMLMGCIPIVQRPELTGLSLVSGKSCLGFDGARSLLNTIGECSSMATSRICRMRERLRKEVMDGLAPGGALAWLKNGFPEDRRPLSMFWFER